MDLPGQLDSVQQQAAQSFSSLSIERLNWKPRPSKWSIGQCLDHLIVSNKSYFPTFDKLLAQEYRLSFLQRVNPFKKVFGSIMVNTLGPQLVRKFKAPKILEPSSSKVPIDIVEEFSRQQDQLK